jgi:hypothetical protein
MLARRHRYFGVLGMRRLEFLATGERQEDEIVSEYLSPIVAAGHEDEVASAFAQHLARESGWEEIVLKALDASAPAVQALESAFRSQGWLCESNTQTQCLFIKLPSTWDGYLSALSSHDRYWVKSSMRDFLAWAGDAWRVDRVKTHAELAQGRKILIDLHHARWRREGQAGVFSSARFLEFHDQIMPALLDRGALDLCWLTVRERPMAVLYNIVWQNRVFCYQIGRTLAVPKRVRPGVIIHLLEIQRAIEEGREEYDFLGGEVLFKKQLAYGKRPLSTLRVARPSLAEAARQLAEPFVDVLRAARRQQRQ